MDHMTFLSLRKSELPRMQERDNRWIALVSDVCGSVKCNIEHNILIGRDNIFLGILIHVSRRAIRLYTAGMFELVRAFTWFDMRHTVLFLGFSTLE